MYDRLNFFEYWAIKLGLRFLSYVGNIVLFCLYWGKGKTVAPIKNELLLIPATKIAEKIRNGEVKCADVVQAYIDRILEVEPDINAVAESRFHEAVQEANEVDDLIQSGKYTKEQLEKEKPLLGVPLTVKVLLNVKGLRNTGASMFFKDSPPVTRDAPIVADMRLAGAIVLTSSNSAELGLGFETNNPLYGRTNNPFDTNRTPGGSSGGESALISSAASVIGLGNDLYGSLRFPAHFTGIYSHKPTEGLIMSKIGCRPLITEGMSSFFEAGPLCRYVEDLVTVMQILSAKSSTKLEFGKQVDFKKLKIFYQFDVEDPSMLPVDKEMKAAIRKAADHFASKYGVEVKEVNIRLLAAALAISLPNLLCDFDNIIHIISDGKVDSVNPVTEPIKFFLGKSDYSLFCIIESVFGNKLWAKHRIPLCRRQLERLRKKFEDILDENSVFFFPPNCFAAPRHYGTLVDFCGSMYSGVFNLLGFPVTQCPLGLNSAGLPHGVQIAARKNNDPLTVAVAEELDKVFGGWIPPS